MYNLEQNGIVVDVEEATRVEEEDEEDYYWVDGWGTEALTVGTEVSWASEESKA